MSYINNDNSLGPVTITVPPATTAAGLPNWLGYVFPPVYPLTSAGRSSLDTAKQIFTNKTPQIISAVKPAITAITISQIALGAFTVYAIYKIALALAKNLKISIM